MVPLSANSKRPFLSATASVKAPFLCPNISLSKRLCEIPPKFTFTKGLLARWLFLWIASAMSSLPVPLSPVIRTEALVLAMRWTIVSTSAKALLSPIIKLRSNALSFALVVSCFSVSCNAVSMRCINAILFQGLVTKSKAPAFMPSTARLMLPHAVIRITGTSGRNNFTCLSKVRPSSPVVEREKFMSIKMRRTSSLRTIVIASLGPETACTS